MIWAYPYLWLSTAPDSTSRGNGAVARVRYHNSLCQLPTSCDDYRRMPNFSHAQPQPRRDPCFSNPTSLHRRRSHRPPSTPTASGAPIAELPPHDAQLDQDGHCRISKTRVSDVNASTSRSPNAVTIRLACRNTDTCPWRRRAGYLSLGIDTAAPVVMAPE